MFFIHYYHDTGKCPRCGSPSTGRILPIPMGKIDLSYETTKALQKGEFVRYTDYSSKNCYCEDCGGEWKGEIKGRWIKSHELCKIKEEKGIDGDFIIEREDENADYVTPFKDDPNFALVGKKKKRFRFLRLILPIDEVIGAVKTVKSTMVFLSPDEYKHITDDTENNNAGNYMAEYPADINYSEEISYGQFDGRSREMD